MNLYEIKYIKILSEESNNLEQHKTSQAFPRMPKGAVYKELQETRENL